MCLLHLFSVRFWFSICHLACGTGNWHSIILKLLSTVVTNVACAITISTLHFVTHKLFMHFLWFAPSIVVISKNYVLFLYWRHCSFYIGNTVHCEVGTLCPYWTYGEHFLQRVRTLKLHNRWKFCCSLLCWWYCTNVFINQGFYT